MAIVVIDPRGVSKAFVEALSGRGLAVSEVTSPEQLQALADARHVELAVCAAGTTPETLNVAAQTAEVCPGLGLVLDIPERPSSEELLTAMRLGVIDVVDATAALEARAGHCADALRREQQRLRRGGARGVAAPDGEAMRTEQFRNEAQLRELQRDQRAGRYIQMGMLPPSPMAIDGYRMRHKIIPSLILSGDFVDYFRITDHHFAFYIADVSGHGASSAFVTVLLKNFSRRLRREYTQPMLRAPGEVLVWLNRELLDNQLDKHVAMFIGIVDLTTNELMFANAGHYPSAILVDEGGPRHLELSGKPVGLFRDVSYVSRQVALVPGCSLYLVSDGVLESLGDGRLEDKERQLMEAAAQAHQGVGELWQVLDLARHESNPDDMACLTVSRDL